MCRFASMAQSSGAQRRIRDLIGSCPRRYLLLLAQLDKCFSQENITIRIPRKKLSNPAPPKRSDPSPSRRYRALLSSTIDANSRAANPAHPANTAKGAHPASTTHRREPIELSRKTMSSQRYQNRTESIRTDHNGIGGHGKRRR